MTLNSLDGTRSATGETGQLERERSRTCSLQSPRGVGGVRSAYGSPCRGHLLHGSVERHPRSRSSLPRTEQPRLSPTERTTPCPSIPPRDTGPAETRHTGTPGHAQETSPRGGHVGRHHTPESLEHTTRTSAAGVTRGHRGQKGRGDLPGSPCSIWLAAATSRVNTAAERLQTEPVRPVRAGASAPAPQTPSLCR